MANPAFGAIPIRTLSGKPIVSNRYYVPSTDSTALFKGDFVGIVNAMDPKGEVGVIKALANTGDAPIGVVVGFEPDPALPYTGHYRPASTNRYVLVCDDPDVVLAIQEDTLGNVVTQANIALHTNCDVNIATTAGSTATGLSGHMLDSSTASASTAVLKILGVYSDGNNVGAQTAGAILEVIILEHALRIADSQT